MISTCLEGVNIGSSHSLGPFPHGIHELRHGINRLVPQGVVGGLVPGTVAVNNPRGIYRKLRSIFAARGEDGRAARGCLFLSPWSDLPIIQ